MMFSKHVEFAAVSFHFVRLYSKEDAALAIGLMALVQAVPVMLLAIPGGQLADRLDRRLILLSTIAITVIASIGMVTVIFLEAPVVWVYVLPGRGRDRASVGQPIPGISVATTCSSENVLQSNHMEHKPPFTSPPLRDRSLAACLWE